MEVAMDRQTPESITQQTRIAEADQLLSIEPIVVRKEDSLQEAAERAVENAGCRVIAVVDDDDRLSGLLPVRVLVNDIFLKIVPEEFLGEIEDVEAVLKYAGHIGARLCGQVMAEPLSVRLEDTVRDAFRRMHAAKLNGLPITDAENRVVGYVDQLELLLVWVRASGRETLLKPQANG
jgi:CBS-domain-containing membrane protein